MVLRMRFLVKKTCWKMQYFANKETKSVLFLFSFKPLQTVKKHECFLRNNSVNKKSTRF